jgi:hypothetical protein
VDASCQQKKRVYEFSGPFGPQTTKTRRQARKDEGGVSSCQTLNSPLPSVLRQTRSEHANRSHLHCSDLSVQNVRELFYWGNLTFWKAGSLGM